MSINRVSISGNLTRDPELRQTAGGMEVMKFGVAVNDRRKNSQTGEWEDYPNFVDCTMFGTRAGSVARFLSKGSKVAIDGKLRWSQWESDGQKRSKLEVIVEDIELMSGNRQGAQQQIPQMQQPQMQQSRQHRQQRQPQGQTVGFAGQQVPMQPVYTDEDIPF